LLPDIFKQNNLKNEDKNEILQLKLGNKIKHHFKKYQKLILEKEIHINNNKIIKNVYNNIKMHN